MEISEPLKYLSGTGFVGSILCKKDWDHSALGDASFWPPCLHTSLGLLYNFQMPMFLIWGANQILFYNDAALPFFGEKGKDPHFLGKSVNEILPQLWQPILPALQQWESNGTGYSIDHVELPIFKNGAYYTSNWSMNFSPVLENGSPPKGVLIVFKESFQLQEGPEKVEESEKKIKDIVNNSPFPLALQVGEEMHIKLANKAITDIWGKGENVIGLSLKEVLPELENQNILEELKKVYESGIPLHINNKQVDLIVNGLSRTYYLNYSFIPMFDKQGQIYGVMHAGADVTDLNIARNKIAESEERFRTVANNAPVLIWMTDKDKNGNFFNEAWLNFTGRSMEEECGYGRPKGVHPKDLQSCLNTFHTSFDQRKAFYMEYRLKRHDGAYRWISESAVPRFTPDGIFEGYIGACMDIHEQVGIHQQLKEEEEKLSIIIQASELGVVEMDLISRKVHCSPRFVEILGYREEVKITYRDILEHVHPDDLTMRNQVLRQAYKTGKIFFALRLIGKDGSPHWIEAMGRAFFNDKNKPVKIIATIRDITEEKYHQQELQESEQKFRLLADSINHHIWIFDPNGQLNYMNSYVLKYCGLKPEELYQDGWTKIIHPEDLEKNMSLWNASIQTGRNFIFDHRLRNNDGTYRWHTCKVIPQRDTNGHIHMWVGTSTDIHEQKKFVRDLEKQVTLRTQELENKNKELLRTNKELEAFAYISSHDLQEPLRKIQTFSSLIMEKEIQVLSEKGKDHFQRIIKSANRMQTLIKDLLTYSRTTTGEKSFEIIDLSEILKDVREDLKEELQKKEAKLTVNGLCDFYVIPFQMYQFFYNLMSNSIKFSHDDRVLHITIHCTVDMGENFNYKPLKNGVEYCHIQFSDNGIGFDPQYNEKIFEVFQRFHKRKPYSGNGIGLAIVKKIVENHNGFLAARGEENIGATFDFFLPTA
ncbi:MAG: PAS domain S-box protein [Cyclobacteriaceae bacterium]